MEIEGEGGVTATEVNTDLKNEMEGSGPGIEDLLRELKELNGKLKEPLPMRLEAIQEMEDALEELKQRARHQIAAVSNMIPK